MSEATLRSILEALQSGGLDLERALHAVRDLGSPEVSGFAHFDHGRAQRTGMEEVIFAPGKRPEQVLRLVAHSLHHHDAVLVTRVQPDLAASCLAEFPQLVHNDAARTLQYRSGAAPFPGRGKVAVVTAGTADLPVAEEAAVTLEHLGCPLERVTDVGVAGIHRLFSRLELLRSCSVLIVVAGMEGALPGVVAGLLDRPVVAVPTSVGVGAHLGGFAPLLTMLNTCAPGVSVVNIDGGFAAACVAHRISRLAA